MTERSTTESATPQLSAALTVTIETAGRAYFDRNDLIQNATHWIESALEDRDGISNVTITEVESSAAPGGRVQVIYDAVDAFQRQHRTGGGLGHAQIRALLAEHLNQALPVDDAEKQNLRVRVEQAEDLLRVAHETSNTSEAERARAVEGVRSRSVLLEEARDVLEAAGIAEAHGGESWPRLVPAIEELAAERDRLRDELGQVAR